MFSIRMMSYLGGSDLFITLSNTVRSRNKVTQSGVELLWSGRELITKVGNNLGFSSYAVPQSSIVYVVVYFRRTELLPGVQERSGID